MLVHMRVLVKSPYVVYSCILGAQLVNLSFLEYMTYYSCIPTWPGYKTNDMHTIVNKICKQQQKLEIVK